MNAISIALPFGSFVASFVHIFLSHPQCIDNLTRDDALAMYYDIPL